MKNVLVFPCGSEIGLEVNRALSHSIHFTLFGGSSVDDHGKFVFKNYIPDIPRIDAPGFITAINTIVAEFNIDFIVPAHDSAVLKLAEHSEQINAEVITSDIETCRICRSKKLTYELLRDSIPVPQMFNKDHSLVFPIFLKPDVGQGSKGTYRVTSRQEIEFYLEKDPTLLIQEYLPGKEYTIDCFTDKSGQLLFSEGRDRSRISNGISVNSRPVHNIRFQELASIINSKINFRGVWFFQVKERMTGELVLMEVAPRIAGTMALFRGIGVNFIQLSLFDRMGYPVSIINNNIEMEIDRALFARYKLEFDYDIVYVDLDDTIILGDQVNSMIIMFLYQARNSKKRIVLLTKHIRLVKETLRGVALSESLFDEIIVIDRQHKKSDYINEKKAIFIDDSFAERKDVNDVHNIPVFGLDAVECLLDWRN